MNGNVALDLHMTFWTNDFQPSLSWRCAYFIKEPVAGSKASNKDDMLRTILVSLSSMKDLEVAHSYFLMCYLALIDNCLYNAVY